MNPNHQRRVVVALIATLLTAMGGVLGGHLVSRARIQSQAGTALINDANRLLAQMNNFSLESHKVLTAMRESRFPSCSDAELASFRTLLMRSEYLRDAGRIRDGRIQCSAALSREQVPDTQFVPEFTWASGSKFYRDMTPYQVDGIMLVSVQAGDLYVVFGPYIAKELLPAQLHYTIVLLDPATGKSNRLDGDPALANAIVNKNAEGRLGQTLYVTRCAPRSATCINTYTTIPDMMRANHQQDVVGMTLGGLAGALTGLLCSLLYRRRRNMEQQLRRAIRADQLRMVYQPIVDLASGRIVGAEALARWTDEEGFAVGPEVFVRMAEQRGFVGKITRLVVRQTLRDFGDLLRAHPNFRLSINVAAADLADPKFLPLLEQSLEHAEVPAQSLAIEITESCTARIPGAMETIRGLRQKGYSVHIDDFGTGYSSLSYLHALAIDAIKIDRAFTQAIGTEAVTSSILPQILAMAKKLNLEVIVEGVETGEQAGYFAGGERPILAQGWYFGRPVSSEAFHRLLTADQLKELIS